MGVLRGFGAGRWCLGGDASAWGRWISRGKREFRCWSLSLCAISSSLGPICRGNRAQTPRAERDARPISNRVRALERPQARRIGSLDPPCGSMAALKALSCNASCDRSRESWRRACAVAWELRASSTRRFAPRGLRRRGATCDAWSPVDSAITRGIAPSAPRHGRWHPSPWPCLAVSSPRLGATLNEAGRAGGLLRGGWWRYSRRQLLAQRTTNGTSIGDKQPGPGPSRPSPVHPLTLAPPSPWHSPLHFAPRATSPAHNEGDQHRISTPGSNAPPTRSSD